MRRFFFNPDSREGDRVVLPPEESRHIAKVLRLTAGDDIELLDGRGGVYHARITACGRRVEVEILGLQETASDDQIPLVVGQGLLKGKKMDTVIQKCTELGVSGFHPFLSERCQGKPDEHRGAKKHERFMRIVEAACKQCYRPDLMELERVMDYGAALNTLSVTPTTLPLLFWEEEKEYTLHDLVVPADIDQAFLLLGPEGGFSQGEVELAREKGWQTVSLGPRILRAETATLTAVSLVQFLLKNI